jgi:hypothetical protein
MPETNIERYPLWFYREVEERKAEVATLEAELADLEGQTLRHSILVQKISRFFGIGVARKLEWVRFKLSFKQEELNQCTVQEMPEVKPTHPVGETARQKMERMIAENPVELKPHIRRVYQSLIDAEK